MKAFLHSAAQFNFTRLKRVFSLYLGVVDPPYSLLFNSRNQWLSRHWYLSHLLQTSTFQLGESIAELLGGR